jgi:hypothetical protein
MTCSNTALPDQRRLWGRIRPFRAAIVALVVVVGIVVLAGLHYRSHLLWQYKASRLGLQDVQSVSDRPMPESPTLNGWVRCRVGCIELSLPPDLAGNRENRASLVIFQHGSRSVVVAVPTDASDFSELLETASELCPQPQRFTMPRLRRACYQASSDDFRWSMTQDEVRWHAFCITTSKLIRPQSYGHTESLFREDLDGIIHFVGDRAVLDWQSNECSLAGYIHLIDRGDNADPTWIRAVCQSLKVLNETETEHQQQSERTATSPPDP